MNKPNFSKFANDVRTTITKNSPKILMAAGVTGMITTTVLAVRATPKALELIEEERDRRFDEIIADAKAKGEEAPFRTSEYVEMTHIDMIKAAWKCYIPSAVIGSVSIACIIGSCSVNARRTAAIATAYKLSETALTEYKDAVLETIGEKKEKEVRDKVAENQLKNNPVDQNNIFITEKGDTLCYDAISGRYFKSDIEKIKKAENELNLVLRKEDYVSLNSVYDMMGLKDIGIGGELGWNVENGYVDIELSAQIAENGQPCIVVNFSRDPKYDYDRYL